MVSAYGINTISGSILLGAIPYRSMHPHVAHPVIIGLIPGLTAVSGEKIHEVAKDFAISCVADGYEIPAKDFWLWAGALALQVSCTNTHFA